MTFQPRLKQLFGKEPERNAVSERSIVCIWL